MAHLFHAPVPATAGNNGGGAQPVGPVLDEQVYWSAYGPLVRYHRPREEDPRPAAVGSRAVERAALPPPAAPVPAPAHPSSTPAVCLKTGAAARSSRSPQPMDVDSRPSTSGSRPRRHRPSSSPPQSLRHRPERTADSDTPEMRASRQAATARWCEDQVPGPSVSIASKPLSIHHPREKEIAEAISPEEHRAPPFTGDEPPRPSPSRATDSTPALPGKKTRRGKRRRPWPSQRPPADQVPPPTATSATRAEDARRRDILEDKARQERLAQAHRARDEAERMAKEARRIADELDAVEEACYQNALRRRIHVEAALKAEVAAKERAVKEAVAIEANRARERRERDASEARKAQAAADLAKARLEDERRRQEKATRIKKEKEAEEDKRRRQVEVAHFKEEARQLREKDAEREEEERRRLQREETARQVREAYIQRQAYEAGKKAQREETSDREDRVAAKLREQRAAAEQPPLSPAPLAWPPGSPAPAPAELSAMAVLTQAGVWHQGHVDHERLG